MAKNENTGQPAAEERPQVFNDPVVERMVRGGNFPRSRKPRPDQETRPAPTLQGNRRALGMPMKYKVGKPMKIDDVKADDETMYDVELLQPIKIGQRVMRPGQPVHMKGSLLASLKKEHADKIGKLTQVEHI